MDDNLIDKVEVNKKEIKFIRDGHEVYWIDRSDVERDGLAWWINHIAQKVWFCWYVGNMVLIEVAAKWGIK